MNSLTKQADLLQLHMRNLFRLNIDALGAGMGKLVALFEEGSATGNAIRAVWTSAMQKLIDGLTSLVPIIVSTFIQFEIYALKAYLALAPHSKQINNVAKALAVVGGILVGVLAVALAAAIAVAVTFLTTVALVWRTIIDWGQSLYNAGKAAYDFGASIIGGAGGALGWLRQKFDEVVSFLSGLSLSDIGKAMIDGLISGITGAAGGILGAVTSPISGAIDGAKKLLQINSPSKVFASIGASTGEGMVDGVQGATADVQDSVAKMVEPPKIATIEAPKVAAAAAPTRAPATLAAASIVAAEPAATIAAEPAASTAPEASPVSVNVSAPALEKSAAPAARPLEQIAPSPAAPAPQASAQGSNEKAGSSLNLAGATFNFYGVEGAEGAESRFRGLLLDVLEGDVTQFGGAVPT